jgi:hypothetical protein
MRKKYKALLLAPTVAAAFLGMTLAAVPANAAPPTGGGSGGGDPAYVIVDPGKAVKGANDSTFYPTGKIGSDTLVVIPNADGSLPNGLTKAKLDQMAVAERATGDKSALQAAGFTVANDASTAPAGPTTAAQAAATGSAALSPAYSCGEHAYAAVAGSWSQAYTGCGVIGTSWSATVTYWWHAANFTSQDNAALGLGWYQGYNGSQFGVWARWTGMGSATSAGKYYTVTWGNVAANAQIMAQCTKTTVCTGGFLP